ncbi:hypothetical protein FisN_9Lh212 [Fistulifera solaris]|uniref:FAS1 domain-containing protein n=1 Tax=Fistulifera solaris TaxID=1519565 RepID=A0A1Z5KL80_FISSO|nr:hypothetical protein FisN_9Lh212 [Fistulifera solaris]|eukprot:GAX27073.1 hypothetical protein FisN_9Lh212 [Fistulifera solaris]
MTSIWNLIIATLVAHASATMPGATQGATAIMPENGSADDVAPTACRSIPETICSIVNLSTLCATVTQAGLTSTLSEGSFTIFAPTDDAFLKLPSKLRDAIRADNTMLSNILLFHVVDEELLSTDLVCNGSVRMANAEETTTVCANDCLYQKGNGNSWEDLPRIISQDLQTCQGRLHVLNRVLLPNMRDMAEAEEENEETTQPEEEEIEEAAPTTCSTIAEIACNTKELSNLCVAMTQVGLEQTLSGGSFTVFAPTNHGFKNLGSKMLNIVLANNTLLTDILLNHVVDEALLSTNLECNGRITMANGKKTTTVCVEDAIFQTCAGNSPDAMPQIVQFDIPACNGQIFVVNQLVLPNMENLMVETERGETTAPDMEDERNDSSDYEMPEGEEMMPEPEPVDEELQTSCSTIAEIACSTEDFSTLCTAVTQAGLRETLSGGSLTVFAPTNEAFTNIGSEMLNAVLADSDLLTDILLCHVVDEELLSSDLECNREIRMAGGKETTTFCADEAIFQTGEGNSWDAMPQIVEFDIPACNGQIFVVNQVILPYIEDVMRDTEAEEIVLVLGDKSHDSSDCETPDQVDMVPEMGADEKATPTSCSTIAEIACSTHDFSTLCTAITQAGLGGTLSEGSFTVFAPTNEAFMNLGSEMIHAVLADNELLTNIVLYHVVDEELSPADLKCNDRIKMVNGKKTCTVCVDDSNFQMGKGNSWEAMPQIGPNFEACNGQIFVVNQVILPALKRLS